MVWAYCSSYAQNIYNSMLTVLIKILYWSEESVCNLCWKIFNNLIIFICQSNAEKHFFFFKCHKTVWYFSLKNRNDLFKELTKQCKKKTLNFPALKFLLFFNFHKNFQSNFFFSSVYYIFSFCRFLVFIIFCINQTVISHYIYFAVALQKKTHYSKMAWIFSPHFPTRLYSLLFYICL